ncbi:hypothetical protein M011DRAFT_474262 [Sporormia fimetaria CBS 119925]|uniref:Uncharacterized protein n=1 Tax=Sporormia fimetaria CBS 119925 TaxID=1340428 RepID=A0A6A6VLT1_9PLEO|nr:hypothetical protein M011DRAFT_474262 [Sporormia fimetaria CBS 119925]
MPPKVTKKTSRTPRKPRAKALIDFSKIVGDTDEDLNSDDEQLQTPSKSSQAPPSLKAIKAREKALADKFTAVSSHLEVPLEKDPGIVVNCLRQIRDKQAPLDKSYDFTHIMKLTSGTPFNLVRQVMLTEGPYAGHVAILLKQSQPFRFLELPPSVRNRIYKILLRPEGGEIPITVTHGSHKFAYSRTFGSKNKLAILAVSKQVYDEATPIAYGYRFVFTGTQVLNIFLLQIHKRFIKYIGNIQSETYNPASARNVFHTLQEATSLRRLSFKHISSDQSPPTAIKNFYDHANTWLHAVGTAKQPDKGLSILNFGPTAFHRREADEDGETQVVQWGQAEWKIFIEGIAAKCRRNRSSIH